MDLIIISGRSGSGKTIALHALEDLGFYCIDNLPINLLSTLEKEVGQVHTQIAVSIDSRNLAVDLFNFKNIIEQLKISGNCYILYLDASDSVLLKRFSETRRKHPLTKQTISLREAIHHEHNLLSHIIDISDFNIDTSNLTQHELYQVIHNRVKYPHKNQLQLLLLSFGFKFGIPSDADFVFDVRCLPNPYWEPVLRNLTGLDTEIINYLDTKPQVNQMLEDLTIFTRNWLPRFQRDNRSYLTIAIGCTGGRHRSVYLTKKLSTKLYDLLDGIQIRHRELSK